MVSLLVLCIISLLLAIAALIIVGLLRTQSASQELGELKVETYDLQGRVQAAENNVAALLQCEMELNAKVDAMGNCSQIAADECSFLAQTATQSGQEMTNIATVQISALQQKLSQIIADACTREEALASAIALANNVTATTTAVPARVQSGNYSASLEGGQTFDGGRYGVYQLTLGAVRETWLQLDPWPIGLSILSGSPSILNPRTTFHSFDPPVTFAERSTGECQVVRPLLPPQAEKMRWSNPTFVSPASFEWNCVNGTTLEVTSAGTALPGYSFYLLQPLKLMGQFI